MKLLNLPENRVARPRMPTLDHIKRVLPDPRCLVGVARQVYVLIRLGAHRSRHTPCAVTKIKGRLSKNCPGSYGTRSVPATMLRIIAACRSRSTTVDMPADHIPSQVAELKEQLAAQKIPAADDQIEKLDLYRRLLWSWNERMNLTRHTTLEKFVGRDVVDSYELS